MSIHNNLDARALAGPETPPRLAPASGESETLVGTSAGALNAALVASRPQIPATADELARVWRCLLRDIAPISHAVGLGAERIYVLPTIQVGHPRRLNHEGLASAGSALSGVVRRSGAAA
jgi:hypothetical protein